MEIRLELCHKKAKIKKILLCSDTVIGRSTDCNLRLASNEVSRQHCKIRITEDTVTVRDLGSSNGTFVNGYQLEADTDYEIAPDSELSIGGIRFFVRFSPSNVAEAIRQSDGLGSTVDLKPSLRDRMEDTLDAVEEAPAEAVQFAEADDTAPPSVESKAETDTVHALANASATDEDDFDVEMSTYGDSAILERDDPDAVEDDLRGEDESKEIVDLELAEEPEPVLEETKKEPEAPTAEDDVAEFLNPVEEDEDEANQADDDESLGDFLKQFGN